MTTMARNKVLPSNAVLQLWETVNPLLVKTEMALTLLVDGDGPGTSDTSHHQTLKPTNAPSFAKSQDDADTSAGKVVAVPTPTAPRL
jgi:hypothetical protein